LFLECNFKRPCLAEAALRRRADSLACLCPVNKPIPHLCFPFHRVPVTKDSIKSPLPLFVKEGNKNEFFAKEETRLGFAKEGKFLRWKLMFDIKIGEVYSVNREDRNISYFCGEDFSSYLKKEN
jgi:hypothetical protein